ncbi:MAG: hypothetical protein ACYCW6_20390, partial [Candidatus Xenobia bacterium]
HILLDAALQQMNRGGVALSTGPLMANQNDIGWSYNFGDGGLGASLSALLGSNQADIQGPGVYGFGGGYNLGGPNSPFGSGLLPSFGMGLGLNSPFGSGLLPSFGMGLGLNPFSGLMPYF